MYVHVVYLPYLEASHELKTKPAQNAVRDLREAGIHPDVIMARAEHPISENVCTNSACSAMSTRRHRAYAHRENRVRSAAPARGGRHRQLTSPPSSASSPQGQPVRLEAPRRAHQAPRPPQPQNRRRRQIHGQRRHLPVRLRSHQAAGWANRVRPEICWIDAEQVSKATHLLDGYDGLIVPGGFGSRGVEGKIPPPPTPWSTACRTSASAYGMQMAVIAWPAASASTANTTEVDPGTTIPSSTSWPTRKTSPAKAAPCASAITPASSTQSLSAKAYGAKKIDERHRHRYEFNNAYREQLTAAGLRLAGLSPDKRLVEIIEIDGPPVLCRQPIPPRVQVAPQPAPPALRRLHQSRRQRAPRPVRKSVKRSIVKP
jgi:CTP synthase